MRSTPRYPAREQLNAKIAEQDYKQRHKLASLADQIDEEFSNHLKRGDYNFHAEKFEVIDLGDLNVDSR